MDQVENTNGWTALIWAVKQGHVETTKVLLEHRANRQLKDFSGKTAMDWARETKQPGLLSMFEKVNPTTPEVSSPSSG